MGDVHSASLDLLKQLVADYSKAVASYSAAVVEMVHKQGMVPETEYIKLKAVVAAARKESFRTRKLLDRFREHSSTLSLNEIVKSLRGSTNDLKARELEGNR